MTQREQQRAWLLTQVLKDALTMPEAADRLGLSERQLWRLRTAFERNGPAGLVHGNRGRPSARRIEPDLRARIVELHRTMYGPLNDSHFCELLAEREGIRLSRESVRAILRAEGIGSARRRRPPKYRSRRPRLAAEGMLLQLDGSRHDWLQGRGPWLTLIGAIDDATGRVVGATFRDQEDAAGYLEILRGIVARHGIPGAIYRDRHGAFAPTNGPPPDEAGVVAPSALSQVGRALVELGIDSIVARSPQAKGRVERLWGTCQDRLVVELRLAGVSDRAGANAVLAAFLPRFNARLAVPAADPEPAWRPVPADVRLERIFVFKYRRKVARDHTIRLAGQVLQLPRGSGPSNYAGKLVEVHVGLDGAIVVFDGERRLLAVPAPADPVQLRAAKVDRALPGLVPAPATIPWTPSPDHPWKRIPSTGRRNQRLTDSLGR